HAHDEGRIRVFLEGHDIASRMFYAAPFDEPVDPRDYPNLGPVLQRQPLQSGAFGNGKCLEQDETIEMAFNIMMELLIVGLNDLRTALGVLAQRGFGGTKLCKMRVQERR